MRENILSYDTDIEILLKANAEECESLSLLHRSSYEKYNHLSNLINVPVIVLSSAIGFATGIEIGYEKINIVLGVASIFVGIIKSIDSYFALPKRAEGHRICSLQYAQFNKRIAVELSLKRDQRQNPKDMLAVIKTDMKNLADIAPLIDYDVIEKFKDKYKDAQGHFATNTANICNGLTPVQINRADVVENQPDDAVGKIDAPTEINTHDKAADILKHSADCTDGADGTDFIVEVPEDGVGVSV
jgi:hypothetical protein